MFPKFRPFTLCALMMLLLAAWPLGAGAQSRTVRIDRPLDLDAAGESLRRALNAWETAAQEGTPHAWQSVTLTEGQGTGFGRATFVLLLPSQFIDEPRLMVVDDAGAHEAVFAIGEEQTLGSLRVLPISEIRQPGRIQVLVRAAEPAALLRDTPPPGGSQVRIDGFESPDRLVISSADGRAVAFGAEYLRRLQSGYNEQLAARTAWEAEPPPALARDGSAGAAQGRNYRDPVNMMMGAEAEGLSNSAGVTLTLVRGDAASLRALEGAMQYDSSGATGGTTVSGAAGPGGGSVAIGRPGDRIRARVGAIEASQSIQVESESFVRVSIGSSSQFTFNGPSGGVTGRVSLRRAGRDVLMDVSQATGDWGFLGAVSTRLRVRDGQTVTLARNLSERTTSQSSGPPIVGGIPWVGPMLGSSSQTRQSSSYILLATVDFD